MKYFALIVILLSADASAELYIFSESSAKNNQTSLLADFGSQKKRTWYSYESNEMFERSVGRCKKVHSVAAQLKPSSDWLVRVDSGLSDICVSWASLGSQWYEVLESIDSQNPKINIWINHSERVVAWSKDMHVVSRLAHRDPLVWRLNSDKSLYENILRWTKISGWQLVWNSLDDMSIEADSVSYGEPFVVGGVLDQLFEKVNLVSLSTYKISYDQLNKVVRLDEAKRQKGK